jgi:hypothetical protein
MRGVASTSMQQQFTGLGIQFRYPDDWKLFEELGDDEASITVASPETAFWSVTILRHRPDPDAVLNTAVDAFRDEYDEIDVALSQTSLANRQVPAAEIDFICLELTNTARLRALRTERFTLLVLYQLTDADTEDQEETLESISASLICESDAAPLW